ncbi:MAG: cupin domain-containing protein [Chloroflexota bacterium]
MAVKQAAVRVIRWTGAQHPTLSAINHLMHKENLRPYLWSPSANTRQAVRSHGYYRVLYVVEGTIEVILPDSNERVNLRVGDRLEVPAGIRHGIIVGGSGAKCLEASLRRSRASA